MSSSTPRTRIRYCSSVHTAPVARKRSSCVDAECIAGAPARLGLAESGRIVEYMPGIATARAICSRHPRHQVPVAATGITHQPDITRGMEAGLEHSLRHEQLPLRRGCQPCGRVVHLRIPFAESAM